MLSKTQRALYLILADFIFIVHLALVLIVSIGWLVPGMYYIFLTLLGLTFLMEIFLGYCPLTPLEFNLRRKLNPTATYGSSCITHYMRALFGRKPGVETTDNPTFFKKHSFLLILLGLFAVSILFRLLVVAY
ncbi:MAG: DUF2784 family protein [bacterium]|nr:DUF2784 family protein [bacterium]